MTQNEMIKNIRTSLIILFEEDFIKSVDSLDYYKSSLRDLIKIKDYAKILNNSKTFLLLKDEVNENIINFGLKEPIIIENVEKCLLEILKLNQETSESYLIDFLNLFNKNYKEIEFYILEKIKKDTQKIPSDDVNIQEFIQNFWNKSCKITLKNAKKDNFNYFQNYFFNRKYESVLETIKNIEFKS